MGQFVANDRWIVEAEFERIQLIVLGRINQHQEGRREVISFLSYIRCNRRPRQDVKSQQHRLNRTGHFGYGLQSITRKIKGS